MHATMGDVFHIPQPGFSPVVLVAGFYTTPWDDAADGDRDSPAGCRLVKSDKNSSTTDDRKGHDSHRYKQIDQVNKAWLKTTLSASII
jgi:hypothetical protein